MRRKVIIVAIPILVLILGLIGIDMAVVKGTEEEIVTSIEGETVRYEEGLSSVAGLKTDCIIVPGAGVKPDGRPSSMLADRLDFAVRLYEAGVAPKLLLSGDNGQLEYNEVVAMQKYVMDRGVPEQDIFLDHAGFSTYDTMYRARDVFQVDTAIVVTQRYHLHRSLYIGKRLGMKVYGGASDQRQYSGQVYRSGREIIAREKDFFKCIFQPEPTYLGEPFPISGDGRETWE